MDHRRDLKLGEVRAALQLLRWYGVTPVLRLRWPGGSPFSWWYG